MGRGPLVAPRLPESSIVTQHTHMKTAAEITAEFDKLVDLKPKVRRFTAFGDDNHQAIEAQLEVLDKRLSKDEIYDQFGLTGDDDIDADEGRDEHTLDNALQALNWIEGDSDTSPSEDWRSLVTA